MSNQSYPDLPFVKWIIWFSILIGLVILQIFVGGGFPSGQDKGSPPISMLVLTFSGFVKYESMMTAMVIGLALAEGTGIFGMFVLDSDFPSYKTGAFFCSIIGIVQFAPTYFPKISGPRS